jgi:glutathione synthase
MIDAVERDGYLIAQEYLAAASEGDTRLFLMNGRPLSRGGKYAAIRRMRSEGDLRSNVTAGGKVVKAEIDDDALRIAEIVRPKLVADGMFLVGLDIAGNKLLEINVFSPGGLQGAERTQKTEFAPLILDAIEKKLDCARLYSGVFDNTRLATL